MKNGFDLVAGSDSLFPMKSASLKITSDDVNGLDKYRDYTGDELCQRNNNVPVGFYRNADRSYKGIVFRDSSGNCTYFDRTHGLVYSFDHPIWKDAIFNLIPDMTRFTLGFDKKKVKKDS